jgi:hypothetical protein
MSNPNYDNLSFVHFFVNIELQQSFNRGACSGPASPFSVGELSHILHRGKKMPRKWRA